MNREYQIAKKSLNQTNSDDGDSDRSKQDLRNRLNELKGKKETIYPQDRGSREFDNILASNRSSKQNSINCMNSETKEDYSKKNLPEKIKYSKIVDAEVTEIVSDEDKSDEEYLKISDEDNLIKNCSIVKNEYQNASEKLFAEKTFETNSAIKEDKNKIEEERIRKDLEIKFKQKLKNDNRSRSTDRSSSSSKSKRSSPSRSNETNSGNDEINSDSSDISNKHHNLKLKRKKSDSNEKDSFSEQSDQEEDPMFLKKSKKYSDFKRKNFDKNSHDNSKDIIDANSKDIPTESNLNSRKFQKINEDTTILNPRQVVTYFCATQGCRSVEEFECLNKIEEGAYGVVYRAKDKKTNEVVALKRLKMEKEREGFPITSIREVDTLLKAQHPNVVTFREIVVGSNMDKIYMVMDYVEHDLKSLMQYGMKKPFMTAEVKTLMLQLLNGIAHLHDNWIIHRDLKTSNLLLSHKGVLKVADFGLAREYGSPLKEYTPVVVTLWYRSPELLLGVKKYSTSIDMWSVGCIFGELMLMKALFPGKNEKDQLDKIFKDLGTPNEKIWPGWKELPLARKLNFPDFPYNTLRSRFGTYLSDKGFELINKLLTYDPIRRITADDALKHEFFKETPLPLDSTIFPTWPAKSEGLNKIKGTQDSEPKAPSAGKMYEKLLGEEEGFVLQPGLTTGFTLR